MKRRHTKTRTYTPEQEWRPGENWAQWVRRITPRKIVEAAERDLDREILLHHWPDIVRVKAEYRRRRR
jgi:hypothetical protein